MTRASPRSKVLIVEDQLVIALATEDMLVEAGYCVCGAAADSTSAVALALEKHPDIIVMDVQLARGLDGVETALVLRGAGITVPIVFVTANADEVTRQRITGVQGASVLFKPVMPNELEAEMRRAAPQLLPSPSD